MKRPERQESDSAPRQRKGSVVARWVTCVAALAVLVGLALAAWAWWQWTSPWQPRATVAGETVTIRIRPGMTLTAAADSLVAAGLLPAARQRVFLWGAKFGGNDRNLHTGRFRLAPGLAPRDLLRALVRGSPIPVRITIPEGVDVQTAAQLVSSALGFSAATFVACADSLAAAVLRDRGWLGSAAQADRYDSLLVGIAGGGSRSLHWAEGYLAPDTYHFAEGTSVAEAVETLLALQVARVDSLRRGNGVETDGLALTPHQLVALASIVEAEARRDDERARIAAVYVNRLRAGRRLEADPTVAFILDKQGERLWYRDLEVDSPYNTYRVGGLPPGPIGTPGFASLRAAAYPDTTCDALFFVADGEGGHVFSKTAAEHRAAVARYRELRKRTPR